jgi:hypothetical protein
MKTWCTCGLVLLAVALFLPAAARAADGDETARLEWPREIRGANGDVLTVHQPQVDRWADDHLEARIAVALQIAGESEPVYGALWVKGDTRTNLETRVVTLGNLRVVEARFPATKSHTQAEVLARFQALFPTGSVDIALDDLLANVERTKIQGQVRETELGPEVPQVIVEDRDARLVLVDGQPSLAAIEGTGLLSVVNTDWHILLERASGLYFLRLGDGWVTSPNLMATTWTRATRAPQDLARIPDGHPRAGARNTPVNPTAPVPRIHVATRPTELVVTDGAPRLSPIPGTGLLYVVNTDDDLFLLPSQSRYYLLASGRWLVAPQLAGPWTGLAGDLPGDFQRIPANHPKAAVRVSVPGTPQAEEAVLLSQIPQRSVIERKTATVDVTYDGAPRFERCAGSAVAYAVNSPYDVLLVDRIYYCCHQGVWFLAPGPTGPWAVCDHVPTAIYGLGPRCPVYRVTYVYVYDSTPDLVVVGYLPGYLGLYVGRRRRAVVFGTGWLYRPWIHAGVWFGWPLTFGVGVVYHPWVSGYVFGARYYTPLVRRPLRSTWYPLTARFHARFHTTNAYARWGPQVIHGHAQWLRRSHLIGTRGTLPGFGAVGVRRRTAPVVRPRTRTTAPRRANLFVGGDGHVYRSAPNGVWQRLQGRTWTPLPRSTTPAPRRTTPAPRTPRTRVPSLPNIRSGLDRALRNRTLGSQRLRQFQTWRQRTPSAIWPGRRTTPAPRVPQPRSGRAGGRGGRRR